LNSEALKHPTPNKPQIERYIKKEKERKKENKKEKIQRQCLVVLRLPPLNKA
jgi:hypothetical protein